MRLKIEDEYGIITENARKRDAYAHIVQKRVDRYFESPEGRARLHREVDARVKAEVDEIIARRTREQIAEIAKLEELKGPPVGEILVLVSDVTGCPVPDLLGPRRARNCSWPRFLAVHLMLVCRPDLSTPAIGRVLGNRDHTTILAARNKFAEIRDGEPFSRWLADERVVAMLAQRPQLAPRPRFGNPMAEAA